MGLDMYLEAEVHTSGFPGRENPLNTKMRAFATELGLPEDNAGDGNYGSVDVVVHAGYWRKANAIHQWFVENVQDGVDECQRSDVTVDDLRTLRDLCKEILEAATIVVGTNVVGYRSTTDDANPWEELHEAGRLIVNVEVAEERLPTTSGFFFGGTQYDDWYIENLEHTIKVCDHAITKHDEAEAKGVHIYFYYRASW